MTDYEQLRQRGRSGQYLALNPSAGFPRLREPAAARQQQAGHTDENQKEKRPAVASMNMMEAQWNSQP